MSNEVDIEVQDQFGRWHHFRTVSNNPSAIQQGLQAALKTQLAKHSGKARAVDADNGTFIDILFDDQ